MGTLLVKPWWTRDDWYTNDHFYCFDCLLIVFDDWYTVGTLLVSLGRHVTIGTPMVIFAVLLSFDCF